MYGIVSVQGVLCTFCVHPQICKTALRVAGKGNVRQSTSGRPFVALICAPCEPCPLCALVMALVAQTVAQSGPSSRLAGVTKARHKAT